MCGMDAPLSRHDAVVFAQFSACDNPACIKAKQEAEQLAEQVFMVWDSHGPHGRLVVTMKLPRTVEFHEKGVPTKDVFSRIYSSRFWGNAGGGSGIGSEPASTAVLRPKVVDIIRKYGIKSLLDAPCGSLAWMPLVLEQVPDITYTGMDVACDVIAGHQVAFANRTNWRFYCADVCHQGLPKADMVFSRDSLQHLPLSYAHAFLRNVRESGARYLLVGSYMNGTTANIDVPIGGYYHINVLNPPFSLRHALLDAVAEEVGYSNDSPKTMLLLDVSKM
ncbi:hypothetical protein HXX76_015796 [Chlamydomonas incerta]|uniref:Methyltransferase domain-containing protein n=1 Tax=Chlamydomonas incerta TaxID=51695 RepID=A0A835SC08_CHLIN|nr:hypothetical protein HXX76_015796 [Chlamydomonas incerta]|eukprot:KAG2422776.1 hypothetical protein HXX76_015796 [Chlamydomonas incerta]